MIKSAIPNMITILNTKQEETKRLPNDIYNEIISNTRLSHIYLFVPVNFSLHAMCLDLNMYAILHHCEYTSLTLSLCLSLAFLRCLRGEGSFEGVKSNGSCAPMIPSCHQSGVTSKHKVILIPLFLVDNKDSVRWDSS